MLVLRVLQKGPPACDHSKWIKLLEARAHPLTPTITAIRGQLLTVPAVVEAVKWNSPNYALADDFATMSLRRDDTVQLILHTGAKIKPDHPEIVLDPFPHLGRRADRNRVILTYSTRSLSADATSELATVLRAWTTQLA